MNTLEIETQMNQTAASCYHLSLTNSETDIGVLFTAADVPMLVVYHYPDTENAAKTGRHPADWFDLSNVMVDAHAYSDSDGLDTGEALVEIEPQGESDTINIKGVAHGSVWIDYADYVDETPRLIVHTDETEEPNHAIPL